MSRGSASVIMFTYASLLITMCKNLITRLRETVLNRIIPFDSFHTMHKIIALISLVFTCKCFRIWLNWIHFVTEQYFMCGLYSKILIWSPSLGPKKTFRWSHCHVETEREIWTWCPKISSCYISYIMMVSLWMWPLWEGVILWSDGATVIYFHGAGPNY